jgi:DNA polymerase I-like protein with 3'-5' exonuclease and polymerase domains
MLEAKYKGRGAEKKQVGWTKKAKAAQERIARVCAGKGIAPLMTRPKNKTTQPQIAIDRRACHWANDPLMLRRAEYVTAEKMLSTYVPFLEAGVDGPVTSRFNLAATGRTTSSTPRQPAVGGNMQNMARKTKELNAAGELVDSKLGVRECFAARDGRIYLSGDFAGAELHGVAQVCFWKFGYSVLGDVLKAGRDAHLFLAAYLLGGTDKDYDDVVARYEQGDPVVVEARQESKPGNFGFWGGMGVRTFILTQLREGKHWTKEAATRLRAAWIAAYPETGEYFEANKIELGPHSKAVVEFYWSKRLRKVQAFTTICNGWFQAIVADGAKKACNEVIRRCYTEPSSPLYANRTRPVNFIHDELITETDFGTPEQLAPVVAEFRDTLQNEFNELVPDYPTTVDTVLSYTISKRAKPVYNEGGLLIPWIAS